MICICIAGKKIVQCLLSAQQNQSITVSYVHAKKSIFWLNLTVLYMHSFDCFKSNFFSEMEKKKLSKESTRDESEETRCLKKCA